MRQLLPLPAPDVDPALVYGDVDRTAPEGRPWLLANMVCSVDGSAAVGDRSGPLAGAADRAVFRLLRSLADVVLVGAATVRIEGYGPVRGDDPAPVAVVSRSLDLELGSRLFTASVARPLVVTCASSPEDRRRRVAEVADVVVAGDDAVDVTEALVELGRRGHATVLCEGGPALLGQLVAADAVDELCLTVSPLLVAGSGPRIVTGADLPAPTPRRLASLLEEDGNLFLRYLRA